jgi:hypothetical protein
MKSKTRIKIDGIPSNWNTLPFGRQIEFWPKLKEFKESAKKTYVSQKRKSGVMAWSEFVKLYKPKQFYAVYHDSLDYRDDSYEVFYQD